MITDEKYIVFQDKNGRKDYIKKEFYDRLDSMGKLKNIEKLTEEPVSINEAENILNGIKKIK